jgi:hypothetical protein
MAPGLIAAMAAGAWQEIAGVMAGAAEAPVAAVRETEAMAPLEEAVVAERYSPVGRPIPELAVLAVTYAVVMVATPVTMAIMVMTLNAQVVVGAAPVRLTIPLILSMT